MCKNSIHKVTIFLRFYMSLSLLLVVDFLKVVNTENILKHSKQQLDNVNSTC